MNRQPIFHYLKAYKRLVLKQTLYLFGPLFLVGVWGLVTQLDLISPLLLPAPHHVFEKAADLFIGGVILPDIYYTLYRAAGGYAIGIVLGTILGIATGLVASIHRSLEFVIDFGRSIPVITLYPLFMILFGIGDLSRMTTAAYPVMMIVLINTLYGVRNVKPIRKEVAKTKRLSLWRTLHWVIFPEALPQIVVGYRISLSWAYLLAIVTEMFVGAYAGLGSRVSDAYVSYEVAELYATILTAGTVGYLLNKGFVFIEKRVIHWSDK